MRKNITILLIISFIISTLIPTTIFAGNGDIIGYAKYTDISAYINNYPITSYNINDYTAVVAEDLVNYGFDVAWNGGERTLSVSRNPSACSIKPCKDVYKYSSVAGKNSYAYLETDIKTYVNGEIAESFNIDGETCIFIDALAPYGEVSWYPDSREIKLQIDELPTKDYEAIEEALVTVMYMPDGSEKVVDNSEVEAYRSEGWFTAQSDIIDPTMPMVCLTFDDGPNPATTNRILDALGRYNARATFFVLGERVGIYTDTLIRIKEFGCQIGNHSYNHPQLTKLTADKISYQLDGTSDLIENKTGTRPSVIRPPYGAYNSAVLKEADAPLIMWSIDTLDWKSRNAKSVTDVVLSEVEDGDIILMHDLYESTAAATEILIPSLLAKGFQLVTVDELAYYKNKNLQPGSAYSQIR